MTRSAATRDGSAPRPDPDVVVLGAGPAGLAIAGALVARGLRVALVAPDLGEGPPRWRPTYCAWEDELADVGFADVAGARWPGAVASFGGGRVHDLGRAYARVDNARLAARLWQPRVDTLRAAAAAAEHDATGTILHLAEGPPLRAALVVDAAGHRPALVRTPSRPAPAFQTAVGRLLDARDTPWPRDRAVLMDYTPVGDDDGPPSFLYVLPEADGRVFVEETVLAARPAVPADVLRARLHRRLAAAGVDPAAPSADEEWVSIPMGGALPGDARVLAFGAAAGMIHPASGYLLPRVLGAAEPLADAIVGALGAGGPAAAAAAGWEALWPAERRQRRALYRFGLEALLGMDAPATRAFFDAFFRLPAPDWSGYLSDRLAPADLARAMATLFSGVSPAMKWRLARAGLGPEGLAVARAMLGG